MDWKILVVCFIGSIAATAPKSVWHENNEYHYDVEGRTLSGHPDVGNQYSGIIVQCRLKIIVRSNGNLVGQILDAKYAKIQTHLSDGPYTRIPQEKLTFNELKTTGFFFDIEMNNGIVELVRMINTVPNWEINMIKSILSQIQLDTRGKNLINGSGNQVPDVESYSGSYKTMEESILGKYEVLYEVNQLSEIKYQDEHWRVPFPDLKGDGEIMEIVKTKNFDNSDKHVGYHRGTGDHHHWKPFSNNMGEFFSRSSVSRATLSGKLDKFTIQSVETTNQAHISPAHNGDQKMTVSSQYKLILSDVKVNTFPPPPLDNPEGTIEVKSLVYKFNKPPSASPKIDEEQDSELFGAGVFEESGWIGETGKPLQSRHVSLRGRSVELDQGANISHAVIQLAQSIGQDLMTPGNMPKDQTLSKFVKLNQFIRLLNTHELKNVSEEMYCYCKDDKNCEHVSETSGNKMQKCNAWKVYCDGLAEGGSPASLMEIQRLVVEKKLDTETAAFMILQIVKSVQVPNLRYMRMFYSFCTHPAVKSAPVLNAAALFAYSRLVGSVYVDQKFSESEYPIYEYGSFFTPEGQKFTTEEFIPYLSKELDNAIAQKDNKKAQVYIYALSNVGHPKILNEFKKYLEGKTPVSHFLRTQMVTSLWRMSMVFPEIAQPVLNKLYRNPVEHTEVRIAALQLLPFTNPSASMFQKIATNIYFDLNTHVNAAADSMIRTLAELQSHSSSDVQMNAQSAVHLLPKRKYGWQYSKSKNFEYFPETKTIFNEFVKTVGAEDASTLQYGLFATGGRLGQTMFSLQYMTNSMEALMKVLRSEEDNEKRYNTRENDSQWSSDQVTRNLKIEANKLESPEANIYFGMSGLERYFTFDVQNLKSLKNVIVEIKNTLKNGKDVHITKFVNQHNMAMGFPTETGLPTWYSSDNPLLVNIEGRVSGDLQTKEKSSELVSFDIDSKIRIVVSKKMQDRVGFIAPFEHHHYIAGHDVNAQAYLPLKMKIKAMHHMKATRYEAKLEPFSDEKLIRVVHFSTVPYTSRHNILKLKPIIGDSETHIINAQPKGQFHTVVGQDVMGMSWRVGVDCEQRILRDSRLFNAIGDHRLTSSLLMHLFYGYIHNSKVEISYDVVKSNSEMDVVAIHEQHKISSPRDNNSNQHKRGESFDARKLFGTQDSKQEVLQQASKGLSNPTVNLYQLIFMFKNKYNIGYNTFAGIAKSDNNEEIQMILLSAKESHESQDKNYKAALFAKSQTPNVNSIDPFFALKHAPYSNVFMKLAFGKDYETATRINTTIEMSRSHARNRYLHGSEMARNCIKESGKGDLLLAACSQLHLNANSLDQIRVQLHHENLKPHQKNITNHFVNYVKHYWYDNVQENSVNASGSGKNNKVDVRIHFHNEFDRVNLTANSAHNDLEINNVYIPSWLRPVVKIHPTYNAFARVQSQLFESQWYQASCAVDQSTVTTFDNRTYMAKEGDWTVMFLHVPNRVSKSINSASDINDDGEDDDSTEVKNNEELLVLTRHLNKEMKITVRTPETHFRLFEIDMTSKAKSQVEVYVNQQKHELFTDRATEFADGFIKMLLLPNQEVQFEIKDAFTVFYDGSRARLTTHYGDRFRNKIRGLCGNFNSEPSKDLYAPKTCVYNNVEEFVAAYQPYQHHPVGESNKHNKCSYDDVIYGNVISDYDLHEAECTEHRRIYTVIDNTACISLKPVRVCKLGCKATKSYYETVLANCIENDEFAQRLLKKIDNNEDSRELNFGNNLKEISMKLPKICSRV